MASMAGDKGEFAAQLAGGLQKGECVTIGGQQVTVMGLPARRNLANLSVSVRYPDGRIVDVRASDIQRGGGYGRQPGNQGPGNSSKNLDQLANVLARMNSSVAEWRARGAAVSPQEIQQRTSQLDADIKTVQATVKQLASTPSAPVTYGAPPMTYGAPPMTYGAPPPPQQGQSVRPQDPAKNAILDDFKKKIHDRCGAGGITAMGRRFQIMDDNHNGQLNAEEMRTGLNDIGLRLPVAQIKELIKCIDKDGSGNVSYDDFLVCLRGDINPRREKFINMAFDVMDRDGSGQITVDDIAAEYDVKHDADVLSGKVSPQEALQGFLNAFDGTDKDGIVTKQEFLEHYRNISASIDNDDYFELMIRNAWHITGGEGWCQNTSNLRCLVVFKDGSQKVIEIKNDLGLDKSNNQALLAKLKSQGVTNVAKATCSGAV